jgi:hypothetical protein
MDTEILIEACEASAISALDLKQVIQDNGSEAIECYSLTELGADGYRKSQTGWLLWLPEQSRAGIAWGADADWTDADSPEHALSLWQSGEMMN